MSSASPWHKAFTKLVEAKALEHGLDSGYYDYVFQPGIGWVHQVVFYGVKNGWPALRVEYTNFIDGRFEERGVRRHIAACAAQAQARFMSWFPPPDDDETKELPAAEPDLNPLVRPKCDCGAEKAKTPHARWCTLKKWMDRYEEG